MNRIGHILRQVKVLNATSYAYLTMRTVVFVGHLVPPGGERGARDGGVADE